LDKMASRMVERPSDYSFHLQMFEGLPTWIYNTLLEHNILPKFCTLEDIRENARQIKEISLHVRNTFKGSSAMGNNSRSSTYRATTPRNNNIPHSTPTGIIPLIQIRKGSPPLEIMEIIVPQ
jgi:hypothetical protein